MNPDPYGDTKEVATDHPDWLPYMTQMNAQDPSPVRVAPALRKSLV